MWHTPNSYPYMFDESTEEGVINFLKASKECGFNRIYIETKQRPIYIVKDVIE